MSNKEYRLTTWIPNDRKDQWPNTQERTRRDNGEIAVERSKEKREASETEKNVREREQYRARSEGERHRRRNGREKKIGGGSTGGRIASTGQHQNDWTTYLLLYRSGNNGIPIMKWISLGTVGHRCTRQEILRMSNTRICSTYRSHVHLLPWNVQTLVHLSHRYTRFRRIKVLASDYPLKRVPHASAHLRNSRGRYIRKNYNLQSILTFSNIFSLCLLKYQIQIRKISKFLVFKI